MTETKRDFIQANDLWRSILAGLDAQEQLGEETSSVPSLPSQTADTQPSLTDTDSEADHSAAAPETETQTVRPTSFVPRTGQTRADPRLPDRKQPVFLRQIDARHQAARSGKMHGRMTDGVPQPVQANGNRTATAIPEDEKPLLSGLEMTVHTDSSNEE